MPDARLAAADTAVSVFWVFLKLGLTAFGGPVAHLAFFRAELVQRRQWLSEAAYAQLVALCHLLPGPASSQVGMALGLQRAGWRGMVTAWLGFTLPSALALALLGVGWVHWGHAAPSGLLQGLKIAAAAVVLIAVRSMAITLCPDTPRRIILAISLGMCWIWPGLLGQLSALILGGALGLWWLRMPVSASDAATSTSHSRTAHTRGGWFVLALGLALLALPVVSHVFPGPASQLLDTMMRTGSLVFGGGHVVLPLLQSEWVHTQRIDADTFMAGYAAAQAVPGPLFTFAAFVGAVLVTDASGWGAMAYAMLAVVAIFAPSFALIVGVWPYWQTVQHSPRLQLALLGVNAAVVGLLGAVLLNTLLPSALTNARDFVVCLLAVAALLSWRLPPWLVVAGCGLVGAGLLN